MTDSLLTRFFPILKAVSRIKDKKLQRKLLHALSRDPCFRDCMKEIAVNLVNENVPLTLKDKRRLNKHGRVIRSLKHGRSVSQSGGFLNIVVPLLASVVGELIASAAK